MQQTYNMQGAKYMQRPIICKGKIYAKTYIMQGGNIGKNQ